MKKRKSGKQIIQGVESPVEKQVGRRIFLNKLWIAVGLLAGLESIAALAAYLFSGKRTRQPRTAKQLIEAGPADSFLPGSVTPFRGGRFYLARLDDGGYIALSLRCTHLGCSINWEEKQKRFICPCHASAFDMNGGVRNSPAPKALDYYPVVIENGIVKVDVGTTKERVRFSKDQVVYA
jgi:cytochrome b6-f complex iron-sulfur subunit